MGIHRTPDQLKPEIMKGTLRIIAEGGMDNFSFPKLTAVTGISAPTVYEHFKNKEDLLARCFLYIERELARRIELVVTDIPAATADTEVFEAYCRRLWESCWEYLTSDADRTEFYWNFYSSRYFTAEMRRKRKAIFSHFYQFMCAASHQFSVTDRCNVELLLVNIITGTVGAAGKMLKGVYPNNEITKLTAYNMVFQPIFVLLGIQRRVQSELRVEGADESVLPSEPEQNKRTVNQTGKGDEVESIRTECKGGLVSRGQ